MLGLDAAGKTTVLYKLKLGEHVTTIPTIGFNVETIEYNGFNLNIWDIGGQDRIRALWRHYYHNTQGLIFVVDSNDIDRIDEARDELHKLLEEDELRDAILLVYANKQDLLVLKSTRNSSKLNPIIAFLSFHIPPSLLMRAGPSVPSHLNLRANRLHSPSTPLPASPYSLF